MWGKRIYYIITGFLLTSLGVLGQDAAKPPVWEINGYIKNLQTLSFDKDFKNSVADNLLHNRINIKWKPRPNLTGALEIRNRVFWGETVKNTPDFANSLRDENESVNLNVNWINTHAVVLHTNVERLWMEYREDSWVIRAGRQRINWGVTTIWNPNDIFNSYNFLDFDYEERPGADAIKVQYSLGSLSNIGLASSITGKGKITAAGKYFLNRNKYDIQFIGGLYKDQLTAGLGWAGSVANTGFKGELQYFAANKDSAALLNICLEADRTFKKGWYLNGGMLINSNGIDAPIENPAQLNFKLSASNLMPTRWNFIGTTSKEITPLLTGTLSVVYSPKVNLLLLLPSVQYNIASNVNLSFVWQSFFFQTAGNFEGYAHLAFIRMKWNF